MNAEIIRKLIDESIDLVRRNDLENAIRVSSQATMLASAAWRAKYDDNEPRQPELALALETGLNHALLFFMVEEYGEALNLAVMMDVMVDSDGVAPQTVALQLMKLRTLALDSLLHLLGRRPVTGDQQLKEHVTLSLLYLLGLTYSAYNDLINNDSGRPGDEVLQHTEGVMRYLTDNGMKIPSPLVDVNGTMTDPHHPAPILGDLIGRMRAAGLTGE
ncbi:MAG: hypothetical protein K2O00_04365 [Muribaculaceae bacterium]|nr:hypothetical protein [Muribaculaceae bacterium]